MDRSSIKKYAKERIKNNIWILFAACFVTSVIGGGFYSAIFRASIDIGLLAALGIGIFTGMINTLLSFTLFPLIDYGNASLFIDFAHRRDGSPEFIKLFSRFRSTEKAVAAMLTNLLVYIFTILWTLLFIIPGIVKSYAYSMAKFIVADDEDYSAQAAIKLSMDMMRGNKGKLFLLDLSFIGWHLLCGLTLGILYIYVLPYIYTTKAKWYLELKKEYETTHPGTFANHMDDGEDGYTSAMPSDGKRKDEDVFKEDIFDGVPQPTVKERSDVPFDGDKDPSPDNNDDGFFHGGLF